MLFRSLTSRAGWGLAAILSAGVAVYSYRYVPPMEQVFGAGASSVLGNLFARPWLAVHAGMAATALMLGPIQFLPAWRRIKGAHMWLGRSYVICSILAGLAGLRLAFGTTAGPVAGLGFGTLAVIWLYVTIQAWRLARARRFDEHRRWMIRSFALTFAAVTLRLQTPVSQILGYDFMESYRIIAWSAWVPNLILAEMYLRRGIARLRAAE